MIFRKKIVDQNTEYGDDVSAVPAGKSIISENLSSQLEFEKIVYTTSYEFASGSTRVYLNGMYMTNGQDYEEISNNKIRFNAEYKSSSFNMSESMLSVIYAAK